MKKITMVNPEQICARGWKGLKTKKAVENFATKYRVNRVWWKASATRKVMLIDPDDFRCTWKDSKTTTKAKSTATRKPTTRKTTAKASTTRKRTTSTRVSTRKPVARKRTTTSRPKARTRTTTRRTTR